MMMFLKSSELGESFGDHTSEGADESSTEGNVGEGTEAHEDPEESLTEWEAGEAGEAGEGAGAPD